MASYDKNFGAYYSAESAKLGDSLSKAKSNKLLLDNISTWYIFEDQIRMGFSMLRKYEQLLRANVVEVPFQSNWKYKPEYCSYDLYGTTDFWYLIMFLNNLDTVFKFNYDIGKNILVPSDELLDTFVTILNREDRMRDSLNNPIRIYKHILKPLDSPSKQILPSNFDDTMDGLSSLKEYKNITNSFFSRDNFTHSTRGIIKGILKTEFFELVGQNLSKYKRDYYGNPSFSKIDDYSDAFYEKGFQHIKSADNDIIVEKSGFLRPFKSGNYKFRLSSSGDYQMLLDDRNILNYQSALHSTTPNMAYAKNLFEEYSRNSDFKRRTEDFWDIEKYETNIDGEVLTTPTLNYNSTLNKTQLNLIVNESNYQSILDNEGKIFSVNIPVNGIRDINLDGNVTFEDDGDIYVRIDYHLPKGERNSKLKLQINFYDEEENLLFTKTSESSSYNFRRNPKKVCSEILTVKNTIVDKSKIKQVTINLYLDIQLESSETTATEIISIDKLYLYTLTNAYYETEESIYLDKDTSYKFNSKFQQMYDSAYTYFNLEYKYENEEYKSLPIGWFYILSDTFNSYDDYKSKAFKELSEFYKINIQELLDVEKKVFVDGTKEYLENVDTFDEYCKFRLAETIISFFQNDSNSFAYFLNNMKHLIRMGIYDNDTNELIEEYFVDNFINHTNICDEFGLANIEGTKYRMMYQLPLGSLYSIFNASQVATSKYIIRMNSYGNNEYNIKSFILRGNKNQRINMYLGKTRGKDSHSVMEDAINYKVMSPLCNSAEDFLLIGTCNYTSKESIIDLTDMKKLKKALENFNSSGENGYNTLLFNVITDGYDNNINIDINVTEGDKLTGVSNNFEYPLYTNRLSESKDIPDLYSKAYVHGLLYASWIKGTTGKTVTIEQLYKFFYENGYNNEYDREEYITNLSQFYDLNFISFEDFKYETIMPFFSFNKGYNNEMMTSSIITHPFMPEYQDGYYLTPAIVENVSYIKDYFEIDGLIEEFYGTEKMKLNPFSQHLHATFKNTLYIQESNTELKDDFILKCNFKYRKFIHHENEEPIFSSKQGIFGIIFASKEDKKYVLLLNLYNNTKYISTGIYKYNDNYSINDYSFINHNYDQFRDRFRLVYSLTDEDLANDVNNKDDFRLNFNLDREDTKLMMIHLSGWIILQIGDKTLRIDENKIIPYNTAYSTGKLGFISLNMDGIEIDLELFN